MSLTKCGQDLIRAINVGKRDLEDFIIETGSGVGLGPSWSILQSRLANPTPITPGSAFVLSNQSLLAAFSILLTYLVILIQFKLSVSSITATIWSDIRAGLMFLGFTYGNSIVINWSINLNGISQWTILIYRKGCNVLFFDKNVMELYFKAIICHFELCPSADQISSFDFKIIFGNSYVFLQ